MQDKMTRIEKPPLHTHLVKFQTKFLMQLFSSEHFYVRERRNTYINTSQEYYDGLIMLIPRQQAKPCDIFYILKLTHAALLRSTGNMMVFFHCA